MRDWSYLASACRAYDAYCSEKAWPIPRRDGRGMPPVPRAPHRPTVNGARDRELCRRSALGASCLELAAESGLSPARVYQITRLARGMACGQCGMRIEAGRRKFCASCATTRKRERIRRWEEAKRAERQRRRHRKLNATERAA